MKLTENIQGFIVGTAHYYVRSKDGDEVVLWIDYQNNTYTLEKRGTRLSELFEQEVSAVARDLLARKHGINFANQTKL